MRVALSLLAVVVVGCATTGTSPSTPTTPAPAGSPADRAAEQPSGDPFAVIGSLGSEKLPDTPPGMKLRKLTFPSLPAGVPRAPASCRGYAKPPAAGARCDAPVDLAAIDPALGVADPAQRNERLTELQGCAQDVNMKGLLLALRAELAPIECADLVVAPILSQPPAELDGMTYDALFGLGLAARLARTVKDPPKLAPPYDKARVEAFHKGELLRWSQGQARAIQDMSDLGVKLGYYGRAVVAVEAGMADMRFVDVARAVPVPDEYSGDQELRNQFYMSLDEALEPRKSRGRDAALVGLRGLAYVGVINDARVERARRLLSRMYGGRPIDALDALLLPPDPLPAPTTTEQRVARKLPTFYAGMLLDAAVGTDPAVLRSLVTRGLPLRHRIALRKASLSPELRIIVARARLQLGRTYWRAVDIDEAVALLAKWPAGSDRPPEASLLLAIGLALRGGPADAAEMIRTAPVESLGIGRVAALDALARGQPSGPAGALAAFDAAVIRQVAAPPRAPKSYWLELAQRYRAAARRLADPAAQQAAERRARDAQATAQAIR